MSELKNYCGKCGAPVMRDPKTGERWHVCPLGCPYTFLTRCNEPTGTETFCPKHAKCECGYPMAHNGDCDPRYLDWVDGWNSGYMAGEY